MIKHKLILDLLDHGYIYSIKLPDYIDSVLKVSIEGMDVPFSFSIKTKIITFAPPNIDTVYIEYYSVSKDRDVKLNGLIP